MPQTSQTHKTRPTPNPAERSLEVTVAESNFASVGGVIPVQGTLYSSPEWVTFFGKDYHKEFADFVYTGQVGDYGLAFARNKTLAEANTPFRTTTWFGNHRWPPILLAVAIIADRRAFRTFSIPGTGNGGTGFGPTYYDRVAYIPDVAEGTRFVKDEFFGPTQFNIPRTPVPVPTAVDYLLPGGVGRNFPECLHPEIIIPATASATSQIVGGVASAYGSSIEGQHFPATNFTDWSPYVLSDTQEQQDGGWYRVRIRVFPPAQPEFIVQ